MKIRIVYDFFNPPACFAPNALATIPTLGSYVPSLHTVEYDFDTKAQAEDIRRLINLQMTGNNTASFPTKFGQVTIRTDKILRVELIT